MLNPCRQNPVTAAVAKRQVISVTRLSVNPVTTRKAPVAGISAKTRE